LILHLGLLFSEYCIKLQVNRCFVRAFKRTEHPSTADLKGDKQAGILVSVAPPGANAARASAAT